MPEKVYRAGLSERIAVPPLAILCAYLCYLGATGSYFAEPISWGLYALGVIILTVSLHPFMRKVVLAKDYVSYRKLFRTRVARFSDIEAYWMELFNNQEPRSLKIRYRLKDSAEMLEIKRSRIFYIGQIYERLKETLPDTVPDCSKEVYTSMGLFRRMVNEFHFWVAVVAILVLSFLGSIILPHVITLKPKRVYSEARINLVRFGFMQKDFRSVHDEYAVSFENLNFAIVGKSKYTYFLSKREFMAAHQSFSEVESYQQLERLAPQAAKLLPERSQVSGYTVIAVGNIDDDIGLDIWALSNDSNVIHLLDGNLKLHTMSPK